MSVACTCCKQAWKWRHFWRPQQSPPQWNNFRARRLNDEMREEEAENTHLNPPSAKFVHLNEGMNWNVVLEEWGCVWLYLAASAPHYSSFVDQTTAQRLTVSDSLIWLYRETRKSASSICMFWRHFSIIFTCMLYDNISYRGQGVVVLLVVETIPRLRVEQKWHSSRSPESCGFDVVFRRWHFRVISNAVRQDGSAPYSHRGANVWQHK